MTADSSPNETTSSIPFSTALLFWLKLGLISFGGPAGQISILHQELVERRRWISERRFLHALNYCMLLPGPEAQQLATYLGWLMHRTWGGIVAGTLFVVPSLFLLILLSWVYIRYGHIPIVAGIFYGIKPAVTAIVLYASYRIGKRTLKNGYLIAIAIAAFIAIFVANISFPIIVIVAALLGVIGGRIFPQQFAIGGGHDEGKQSYGPALIDDNTPVPEHARFSAGKLIKICLIGLTLWVASLGLLAVSFGWGHTLMEMGWFFSKAALVTFGGAYAVLPYVYQGAVEHYGWVTALQMMDGLALGETTPGPLIMVVAFVAYVGGYGSELLSQVNPFLAGAIAATVVTWFTFLPSFIFIFAGGALIESSHGNIKLTAPLTAITAAVVGVILNLALFFGYHVIWPQGFAEELDWLSALITMIAAVALIRYQLNIMYVILLCGVTGLIVTML